MTYEAAQTYRTERVEAARRMYENLFPVAEADPFGAEIRQSMLDSIDSTLTVVRLPQGDFDVTAVRYGFIPYSEFDSTEFALR